MPVVKMPNGDLVDMPDNPTPQQLQALNSIRQRQTAPQPISWDSVKAGLKEDASAVWDWAKNLGTAAYKGIADLPAGAADAYAGGYDAQDAIVAALGNKPRELHPGAVTEALNATGY